MELIVNMFFIFIIYLVIALAWQAIELIAYGEIKPRVIDDIVAILLAISIFYNIK